MAVLERSQLQTQRQSQHLALEQKPTASSPFTVTAISSDQLPDRKPGARPDVRLVKTRMPSALLY